MRCLRSVARVTSVILAATLSKLLLPREALASEAPLWEAGVGIGAIAFQDYRGADTVHAYPVPVPYFLYNGTFLKADRDGVRGQLFNQDRMELNLSFNATTPVRNNRVRSGMPDLRSTVETGPALNLHLYRSDDSFIKFDFRMPLRGAVTVEGTPHWIGWTLAPQFALDVQNPLGTDGWNVGVLAGPLFADRRYHEYFYRVAPQYATPGRPTYDAPAGYAGAQSTFALSKRFPRFWVGAFARYDSLGGAAFEDSPLVKSRHYWAAGLGIAWIIHTSAQVVELPD